MGDRATEKMNGNTSGVVPQNQKDLYVDYREMCVYDFLEDLYDAKGGVSGRTTSGAANSSWMFTLQNFFGVKPKANNRAYSFINPNPTENFYPIRVRRSIYVNFYKQYINTKVKGVFRIAPKTTVKIGDVTQDTHQYLDWILDVNGAGLSKNQLLQNLMISVYKDEVAFLVMDKYPDEIQPHLYIQTAKTVESYDTDRKGRLTDITFVNQTKQGQYERNQWTMDELIVSTSPDGKKWDEVERKPIKGIPILAVFAAPRTDPFDYLPEPGSKEIGAMCVSIYDSGSLLDWLLEKQGHDLMWTNGDLDGIREGLTNIAKISSIGDGAASMGILSPDANKATVHQARIEDKKTDLFQLMLDGGVMVSKNNNAPESGVSKGYTYAPVNDALVYTTSILIAVDSWIELQYKVYEGTPEATWVSTTHYKADFSPAQKLTFLDLSGLLQTFEARGLVDNAKHTLKQMIVMENNGESMPVSGLLSEVDDSYHLGTD